MAHGAARSHRPGGACARRSRSTSAAATRARRSRRSAPSRSRPRRPSWRRTTSSPSSATCSPQAARIASRTAPCATRSCAAPSTSPHRSPAARSAEEGARLLAAEWALDDRDAPRAIELLNALPLGVARRTHALRLKLQAARLGRLPQEALKTARLLIKHQGFSAVAGGRPGPLARLRIARHCPRRRSAAPALAVVRSGRPARSVHRGARGDAGERARRERRCAGLAAAALGPCRRARRRGARRCRRGACRRRRRHRRGMAAAPRVGRAGVCRATAPSHWPPAARWPRAALWGKARALLEQAAADAMLPTGGAPQGLDRARRAGRAGGRREPRGTLLRERRTPGLSGSRCYNCEFSGCSSVG